MSNEAIFGAGVTIVLFIIGFVINSYRARIQELEQENRSLREDIKEIREKYVRRDDLNGHLLQVAKSIDDLKDGMKDLTRLVVTAMAASDRER
jgi:septation ring formation regulator EzrA